MIPMMRFIHCVLFENVWWSIPLVLYRVPPPDDAFNITLVFVYEVQYSVQIQNICVIEGSVGTTDIHIVDLTLLNVKSNS